MPDQHVRCGAGEGDALDVDAAAVELVLHEDLGREVADLRTHRGHRPPVGRELAADHHRVRLVGRERLAQAEQRACPRRERRRRRALLAGARAGGERIARLERAAVGHGVQAAPGPAWVVGRIAPLRHRERLRVLGFAQVAVRAPPALAEAVAERRLKQRVDLLAAVRHRELGDEQRGLGGRVGDRPALGLRAERGVLRGHLRGIGVDLVDPRVDAVDVGLDVVVGALAVGAEAPRQRVELGRELLVGEVLVGQLLGVARRGARAEQAGQRSLRGASQGVHEEQALLGGRVARGEHQVVAVAGVDVRHAERLVAEDLRARQRLGDRRDAARHRAEVGALVVAVEVLGGQVRRRRHHADVERLLVLEGRGPLPGRLEGREVGGADRLALALREHRAERAEGRHLERGRRGIRAAAARGRKRELR